MIVPYVASAVVAVLALLACIVAFPGWRAAPIRYWRLALAAATLLLLYAPPHDDLRDPEVWMIGIPSFLVGIGRGTWIDLKVDHGQGKLLLTRAPEDFWIAVVVLLVIGLDVVFPPFGRLDSEYDQTTELALVVLASYMVGRDATILVRSRDVPHHDL